MKMLSHCVRHALGIGAFILFASAHPTSAQAPDEFFKDRRINIIVGASVGGGYDTYARIVARHLGKYLPGNTNFVVQNMAGAGSVIAMSHLANVAPKDGSVLGAINPGGVVEPLINPESARYDPRQFGWIGSLMRDPEVLLIWGDSPISKFEDIFSKELIVGATGGTSASSVLPRVLNGVLGTKIKIIGGYQGANDVILAMERREVHGLGSASWLGMRTSQSDFLKQGKLKVIAQYGLAPHPDLANVPRIYDFAKTDEQKAIFNLILSRQEIGQPYVLPPGVPTQMLAIYQKAFMAMAKDQAFMDETQSRKLELDPMSGEEAAALVQKMFATPEPVVQKAKEYMTAK